MSSRQLRVAVLLAACGLASAGAAQRRDVPPPKRAATIAGRVISADAGRPLPGAQVRLSGVPLERAMVVVSDRSGRFVFDDVPDGTYHVTATKSAYVGAEYGQREPGGIGTALTIDGGRSLGRIDIVLARGSVISGRVTDELGGPVVHGQVRALKLRAFNGYARAAAAAEERTNDLGEYRLFGLSPGTYYVVASPASGGAPGSAEKPSSDGDYAPTYYPGVANVDSAHPVSVNAGEDRTGIDVALVTSQLAGLSGVALDPDGQPMLNARVTLAHSALFDDVASTQTGADGSFALRPVPPGVYTATAVARGRTGEATVATARITLDAGRQTVQLRAQQPGTIGGKVLVEGQPVTDLARVQVRAVPDDPEQVTPSTRSPGGAVKADGTFAFRAPPGRTWLVPFGIRRGLWVKTVSANGKDVTDTGVDVRSGEAIDDIEIVLTDHLGSVSGTVSTAAGKVLKDGYVVVAFARDAERWQVPGRYITVGRPDGNGTVALVGLPPGDYYLVALAARRFSPAYDLTFEFLEHAKSVAVPVQIQDAGTKQVRLTLRQVSY